MLRTAGQRGSEHDQDGSNSLLADLGRKIPDDSLSRARPGTCPKWRGTPTCSSWSAAPTLTWLFPGQPSDESPPAGGLHSPAARRRDRRGLPAAPGLRHGMPARFPVRKTGSAFAKPVDPILGQTIPFAAIGAVRRQDQRPDSHPDPRRRWVLLPQRAGYRSPYRPGRRRLQRRRDRQDMAAPRP
jgi:hypothetical protein